jgi:hypothetical protein
MTYYYMPFLQTFFHQLLPQDLAIFIKANAPSFYATVTI